MNPRQHAPYRQIFALVPLALVTAALLATAAPSVPVGTYLYAQDSSLTPFKGKLTVRFSTPGNRLVVAYGRAHRKGRVTRDGTTEEERERFKPVKARLEEQGRVAHFDHLPPDFYDLVVIDTQDMRWYEGIELYRDRQPQLDDAPTQDYHEEVSKSLSPTVDKVGGWEAFFDSKDFIRLGTDGFRGCMLVQQMRLGVAVAESGEELAGCIHSIDLCWVERTKAKDNTWQVVTRQQLFRGELESREFFIHRFLPDLQGIRIGIRHREIGPIELPTD